MMATDSQLAELLPLLERAYGELMAEFSQHAPTDPTPTWYDPDQTVAFWIRRMAQETVIHRIDAELGVREQVTPVAGDLAEINRFLETPPFRVSLKSSFEGAF